MLMFRSRGTMTTILLFISTSRMDISLRDTIDSDQSTHIIKVGSQTVKSRRIGTGWEIGIGRIKTHLMLHLRIVRVHGIIHIGIALGDSICRISMHLRLTVRIRHTRRIITSVVIISHHVFIVCSILARINPIAVSCCLLMIIVYVHALMISKMLLAFLSFSEIVFLVEILLSLGATFRLAVLIAFCFLRLVLTELSACRCRWTLLFSSIKFLVVSDITRNILSLFF